MKILITGAKGNLGTSLASAGRGHEFIKVDREEFGRIEELLEGAEAVVHAASDLTTPVGEHPRTVLESNLMSTVRLLEALGERPGVPLFFISSCAVYGRSQITSEETVPAPISINGVTKLLNEQVIMEFAARRRLDYWILRPFNLYGGRDHFSILARLQRAAQEGGDFAMNNGGVSQRDFIHVDDAARALLRVVEKRPEHRIINIGSGRAVRIADIVGEFVKKHPGLKVASSQRDEAEYSRGDIRRLKEIMPDFAARDVLDFIRESL
jgi:nucleoside-diphosphate-sugar epimerase